MLHRLPCAQNLKKIKSLGICISLFCITLCMPINGFTAAKDWVLESDGLMDLRYRETRFNTTDLEPEKGFLGQSSIERQTTAVVNLFGSSDAMNLTSQIRGTQESATKEQDGNLTLDELYAEYALHERLFLFGGRRNLVFGQSYGVNPVDMYLNPNDEDRSLNQHRRRREQRGIDMIGVESLLSANTALLAYVAPVSGTVNRDQPYRALIAFDWLFPQAQADGRALWFHDQHPGIGWSFTKTLGQAWVTYTDGTARRGRDRNTVEANNDPESPGSFTIIPGANETVYTSVVLGAGYTFNDGATLNLEYYRNGNGYTHEEWNAFQHLIQENADNYHTGDFEDLPEGNLLRLNQELNAFTLQRDYLFLRWSDPELFGYALEAESTVLHNHQDDSGTVSARLEKDLRDEVIFGSYAGVNYGADDSEYGLRSRDYAFTFYITARF